MKQIEVTQLRVGMFLSELCGEWLDTPFWRKSFPLDDARDIERILDSGIRKAWIDISKGLDVACGEDEVAGHAEQSQEMQETLEIICQLVYLGDFHVPTNWRVSSLCLCQALHTG